VQLLSLIAPAIVTVSNMISIVGLDGWFLAASSPIRLSRLYPNRACERRD
jgi:hypothetical protein